MQPFVDGNALTGLAPDGLGPHDGWLVMAALSQCKSHSALNLDADSAQATVAPAADGLHIEISKRPRATLVTVRPAAKPQKVLVDGVDLGAAKPLSGTGPAWQPDASGTRAWVLLPAGGATTVVVQ